ILNVGYLVIGEDARIGKGGAGDAKFILEYFERNGRSAEILAIKDIDGKKIGSRAIREAVACGDLERAEKLLGRPYALEGRVVAGDGRGASIGFPTANLLCNENVLPPNGVYATYVQIREKLYPSVTNIGTRPTFNGKVERVETHILDFAEERIYGEL